MAIQDDEEISPYPIDGVKLAEAVRTSLTIEGGH